MSDPKIFEVEEIGDVHVLNLCGDMFQQLHISLFREQFLDFIAQHSPMMVVVNFDKVQTLGSEAIGILIHGAQRIRRYQGDIRICSLSTLIRQIFDLCKLVPTVFAAYPSSGDAINSYQ